jgi:hypothetical protein
MERNMKRAGRWIYWQNERNRFNECQENMERIKEDGDKFFEDCSK